MSKEQMPMPEWLLKEHQVLGEIHGELQSATMNYPKFNSAHEGFAVMKEEVDELWDVVKLKQRTPGRKALMREEAIQVAAMAVRFIIDCTEGLDT